MVFAKKELKTLGPFYLQNFITSLSKVILPFYVLYFISIGLSFFQIALLGAIRSIIGLLFEIPTGAIADIYSRKFSVVLGYFLTAVTVAAVAFTDKFYILAAILGFDAFFQTFISGADRAWAFDLAKQESDDLAENYFFKRKALSNAGMIIAPIIAAFIVWHSSMKNLWLIYSFGLISSAIILLFAKNINPQKKDNQYNEENSKNFIYIFSHIKQTLKFLKKKTDLLFVLAAIFFFYFIEETTSLAWTPLLQDKGFHLQTIGYLFSLISILGVIFPIIIGKIIPRSKQLLGLIVISIFYAILLVFAGLLGQIFVLAAIFVIVSGFEEMYLPLEETVTNIFVESGHRATLLSIKSVVESLSSIIGGPLAGLIIILVGKQTSILLSGILFALIPICYLFAYNKNKKAVTS